MILLTAAASLGMYRDTGAITTVHFILIALAIVVTIGAIVWGMRLKRARAAAQEEHAERAEELAEHPKTESVGTQAAEPEPAPSPEPKPELGATSIARPAPPAMPDSAPTYTLRDVKGLGRKAVGALAEQGVGDLAALAALDGERAAAVDAGLGPLAGRMAKDRWVEQARLLTAGDRAGFEEAFGKLGG